MNYPAAELRGIVSRKFLSHYIVTAQQVFDPEGSDRRAARDYVTIKLFASCNVIHYNHIRAMRIAYFTDLFPPQLNGVATSLASQARELGTRGHKILIFAPNMDHISREKFRAENVTVVYLPAISSLFYTEFKLAIFGLPRVIKYMAKFKPDVIHLHSTFTIGMDAVTAAKLFKKPLVATIHIYFTDSDYLRFVKYKLAVKLLNKFAVRYINFLYRNCDLLLTPSKALIEELKENKFKKTVHYLPNGIALKKPRLLSDKKKADIKRKYGLKDKVVLHFGRLSYEKSVDVLIKSFHKLIKNHPNVSLLIIGDGPSKKNLSKLVKQLGIEKNVVFTGFIDHRLLLSSGIFSVSDLFATASTMEVNPMAVLEAMAFGLPIVGVKQAGLTELISSNGCLVKSEDTDALAQKMELVLFNQKMAAGMGKKSLEIVQNYSIDKTVDKLLNMYKDLRPEVVQP